MSEDVVEVHAVDTVAVNGQERTVLTQEDVLAKPGDYDVLFRNDVPDTDPRRGEPIGLVHRPGRRKVACVGFAETTKNETPYDDPSYEIWSLNQHYRYMPRASRWFEIHTRKQYTSDIVPGTDYLKWLSECGIPLYVTELYPDLPTAILFPVDAYTKLTGIWEQDPQTKEYKLRDYTQSSLVYMLALAILEGFDTIATYGVDLIVGAEYFYQKPNMEWLLGFAQGMGYTVTRGEARGVSREIVIPRRSALLRQLYSYGPAVSTPSVMPRLLRDRLVRLADVKDKLLAQLYGCDSAINECNQWLQMYDTHQKGGIVSWQFADGHSEMLEPE